jgi:hypothetical protein
MENEKLLPCKSCGEMINPSADFCPHCGDSSPFYFKADDLKRRGKHDGTKLTRIARLIVIIAIVVSIWLYSLTHIWWLSLVVFVVIIVPFSFCYFWMDDNMNKRFDATMDSDYRFYNGTHHYELTDIQFREWKYKAFQIYDSEKSKYTK